MENTSNRGISPLVVVLLVAALLAVGARVFYFKDKMTEKTPIDVVTQEQNGDATQEQETTTSTTTKTTTKTQPTQKQATTGWKTYQNYVYGFEVKYPSTWQTPIAVGNYTLGPKFEYKVSFRNNLTDSGKGFDVKVYKTKLNVVRIETQTDELSLSTSFDPRSTYASDCGFFATTTLSAVYVPSNDKCFSEAYFFDIYKNNLIYTIIPVPAGGIGYSGYNGVEKTKTDLPEFTNILASFRITK